MALQIKTFMTTYDHGRKRSMATLATSASESGNEALANLVSD